MAGVLDEVASERDDHIVDGIGGYPPLEVGVVRENKEVVPGVAERCERAAVEIEWLGFEHDVDLIVVGTREIGLECVVGMAASRG